MFWLEILVRNLALNRYQPFDLQAFSHLRRETQLVHRTLHAGEPGGRQAVRWQLAINATTKRCGAS